MEMNPLNEKKKRKKEMEINPKTSSRRNIDQRFGQKASLEKHLKWIFNWRWVFRNDHEIVIRTASDMGQVWLLLYELELHDLLLLTFGCD